ncbi:MAG: RNA methyltransferase [Xanthomonadales bacterium]|nr:RNA methyltransferase [Xanthomonadales bacterium]
MKVRFVLVETQFPANIGAAARAMKVMGFEDLWLVSPRRFPDPEANRLAAEAGDILDSATVVEDLDEALAGCALTIATSNRERTADWPTLPADEAARLAAEEAGTCAFVFGPEASGLSSEAVYRARYRSFIPTGPLASSLNLAQAVQVFAYELRRAGPVSSAASNTERPATHEARQHCYAAWRDALVALDFPRRDPDHLMLRFERIFNRAGLTEREVSMLHGLATRIVQRAGTA